MFAVPEYIEYNGERKSLDEWAALSGLTRGGFIRRLRSGWPLDKVIKMPKANNKSAFRGQVQSKRKFNNCAGCEYWTNRGFVMWYCSYAERTGSCRTVKNRVKIERCPRNQGR